MAQPIDLLELIGTDTRLKKCAMVGGRGAEYAGACPFCGGKDRLRVQPEMALWWCRQCSPNEHWQTAADYVMRRDDVGFKEAMRRLGQAEPEPETWDYHDAQGAVIYQVVRFDKPGEKTYAQRTPDERGGWRWGLHGVPPTLYRLPEVMRAAELGETVYITEGEKCADAVRRLGLVATTNSGGAGKWRVAFNTYFDGAGDVRILADNDDAGRQHAQAIYATIRRVVPSARIVEFADLPPGGDVADWLALGHTKDDLIARCAVPPPQEMVAAVDAPPALAVGPLHAPIDFHDLLARPREPIRWYAPGFVREGLGIMAGEANVGKTPLVIQLALAIATGGLWMNKVPCRQAKVLFIGTEYTRDELAYVIESSSAGIRPPPGMLTFKCLDDGDDIQPDTPAMAMAMLEYYFRVEGYEVILIDVLTGFLPDEPFKQSIYRGDYKEFKPYHVLALRYHALILGTWHSTKRETNPRYMYNGGAGLWAVPASRLTLYTDQENRVRIFSMPRFCPKTDWALTQEQTFAGRRWVVSDAAPEPMMSDSERIIWRWLKNNSDKSNPKMPATIADMTGIVPNTVKGTLRRMFDKNLVQQSAGNSGYYIEESVTDVTPVTPVTAVTPVIVSKESASQTVTTVTEKPSLGYNGLAHQDAADSARLQELQENQSYTSAERVTNVADTIAHLKERRDILFNYLRSNSAADQERARALCAQYGIDYNQARKEVQ